MVRDNSEFERMTDREVLVQVATSQNYMQEDIMEIKKHAAETNGTVAALVLDAAKQDGAIMMLRAIMAVMMLGVTVAGVVITFVVARGGV